MGPCCSMTRGFIINWKQLCRCCHQLSYIKVLKGDLGLNSGSWTIHPRTPYFTIYRLRLMFFPKIFILSPHFPLSGKAGENYLPQLCMPLSTDTKYWLGNCLHERSKMQPQRTRETLKPRYQISVCLETMKKEFTWSSLPLSWLELSAPWITTNFWPY